jgi:membrane-bound lytic murein transglycosylase F
VKKGINKIFLYGCFLLVIITNSTGGIAPRNADGEGASGMVAERVSRHQLVPPGESFRNLDLRLVKEYADHYSIDYLLILAIIRQESSFDENAVSDRGARGLMQVMPVTDNELRDELDLGDEEIPHQDVMTGVYYFSKLYDLFAGIDEADRIRLALAAYNAGPSRVYDAQRLAAYLGENPASWTSVRNAMPLLSKRYYSLHELVWGIDRPPAGYFGSSRQTTAYVDAVMKSYQTYASAQ